MADWSYVDNFDMIQDTTEYSGQMERGMSTDSDSDREYDDTGLSSSDAAR